MNSLKKKKKQLDDELTCAIKRVEKQLYPDDDDEEEEASENDKRYSDLKDAYKKFKTFAKEKLKDFEEEFSVKIKDLEKHLKVKDREVKQLQDEKESVLFLAQKRKRELKDLKVFKEKIDGLELELEREKKKNQELTAQASSDSNFLHNTLLKQVEKSQSLKEELNNNNVENKRLVKEINVMVDTIEEEHIKINSLVKTLVLNKPKDQTGDIVKDLFDSDNEDSDYFDDKDMTTTCAQMVSLDDYEKLKEEKQELVAKVFSLTIEKMKLKDHIHRLKKDSLGILDQI